MSARRTEIQHLSGDGMRETHAELEERLLRISNMEEMSLFESYETKLGRAYQRQGKRIAYSIAAGPTSVEIE